MPKGVGSDHTWPEFPEPDAGGALLAAQVPSNELVTIKVSRPNNLTALHSA